MGGLGLSERPETRPVVMMASQYSFEPTWHSVGIQTAVRHTPLNLRCNWRWIFDLHDLIFVHLYGYAFFKGRL